MREVIKDWKPLNDITNPLKGEPIFVNSGIIKAVMATGEKISVARIDYEEYDEENSQYIIMPYWDIIDALPAKVFQGIPGIDMDKRLSHYYRVNYTPVFITERTPSKNREDLQELLALVGLDYYDRFEWLLRTTMRAGNDNLIVERRRTKEKTIEYAGAVMEELQYGDKVIVESIEDIGDTSNLFADNLLKVRLRYYRLLY